MSANPVAPHPLAAHAHLEVVPQTPDDAAVAQLRQRLVTEQSANKAVLAALVELEGRLTGVRAELAESADQIEELRGALSREQAQSEARFHEVKALWSELTATTATLQYEKSKPAWKRLLKR